MMHSSLPRGIYRCNSGVFLINEDGATLQLTQSSRFAIISSDS